MSSMYSIKFPPIEYSTSNILKIPLSHKAQQPGWAIRAPVVRVVHELPRGHWTGEDVGGRRLLLGQACTLCTRVPRKPSRSEAE